MPEKYAREGKLPLVVHFCGKMEKARAMQNDDDEEEVRQSSQSVAVCVLVPTCLCLFPLFLQLVRSMNELLVPACSG